MSVQSKIARADKHITEFHAALRSFIDCKPYTISTKLDPQTRRRIYYLVKADPVPEEMALIAGDIFQNLRTALDYLAGALVRANGESDERTAFPISDVEPISGEPKKQFARQTKGMPAQVVGIIRGLKPYKGGDDRLWRLHKLNNRDKHRLLFTVGARLRSGDLGSFAIEKARKLSGRHIPDLPMWFEASDNMFPLKAGDELFVDEPDAKPTNLNFKFDVALNEPGIVDGESVLAVARSTLQRVSRVVEMFAGMY